MHRRSKRGDSFVCEHLAIQHGGDDVHDYGAQVEVAMFTTMGGGNMKKIKMKIWVVREQKI